MISVERCTEYKECIYQTESHHQNVRKRSETDSRETLTPILPHHPRRGLWFRSLEGWLARSRARSRCRLRGDPRWFVRGFPLRCSRYRDQLRTRRLHEAVRRHRRTAGRRRHAQERLLHHIINQYACIQGNQPTKELFISIHYL